MIGGLITAAVEVDGNENRQALLTVLGQGKEFKEIERSDSSIIPDVAIIDAEPPNSPEWIKRSRRYRNEHPHCAILVLTKAQPYSVCDVLDAGADEILQKPFAIRELLNSMRLHVRNRQWLAIEPIQIGSLEFVPAERTVTDSKKQKVGLDDLGSAAFWKAVAQCWLRGIERDAVGRGLGLRSFDQHKDGPDPHL